MPRLDWKSIPQRRQWKSDGSRGQWSISTEGGTAKLYFQPTFARGMTLDAEFDTVAAAMQRAQLREDDQNGGGSSSSSK